MSKQTAITALMTLIQPELDRVDQLIQQELNSEIDLINQIGAYLINSGGKRIRPMIAVLSAKALNYQGDKHLLSAAFIEFIHTATLLHDDVVDESDQRRGKSTANIVFGNAATVLVGDYIYTRAFQMMVKVGSLAVLDVMSDATNVIAEGEVHQLLNCNDPDVTIEDYFDIIYRKTARLFEVSSQIPAILANADANIVAAMTSYGRFLGTAFQLIDDLLDYSALNAETLGKSIGDDLNEGKPTLPLLHAMRHSQDSEDVALLRQVIEQGHGREHLDHVLSIMQRCGSLQYTKSMAEQEAQKAIDAISILPESPYKTGLIALASSISDRQY